MIYDISPPVSTALKVWPGDTPPAREILRDIRTGDNLTLSTLRATVHLGAHADAPSHYAADGEAIHQRSIEYYLGRCRVIHVTAGPKEQIGPGHLPDPVGAERVLFATGTSRDPGKFPVDFAALSSDLIDRLGAVGVRLVGIDTPSIDLFASRNLPTHKACLRHDMAILEGLVLQEVPAGFYELIALPLRLVGFDASPVRAILRDLA